MWETIPGWLYQVEIPGEEVSVEGMHQKKHKLGIAIATASITVGVCSLTAVLPGVAQDETPEFTVDVLPSVLAEIREAPFSELFTVADGKGYAVKDQDYLASEPYMGFFSLWANVPEDALFGVAVRYCFEETELARADAELVQMTLAEGDTTLVTIDTVVSTEPAALNEIRPPRQSNVSTQFYYDPFYDPFYYSPFSFGVSYSPSTYIPGVECSEGSAIFDLDPVRTELATLPDETLQVRLLFSNGATEYWQLGGGTVRELKNLPALAVEP
jgi:hypothetical protein